MILRRLPIPSAALLLSFLVLHAPYTIADEAAFDCLITTESLKFDLTSLGGEHTVSRTRSTPPSTMEDSVRFDLCSELSSKGGVSQQDQCPEGTRACLTKFNKKDDEKDRIISVIPIVSSSSIEAAYNVLSSPKGLSLVLHGPKYADGPAQYLNVTLLCTSDASDPTFVSYNGSELNLEWQTPVGCGDNKSSDDKNEGADEGSGVPPSETVGSGIGWFFLVLFLALVAYFGLGAYYNYSTYGATGKDLIPHRDFWQEVPYMLSDVVSHLCSSVRPRRAPSRGGYISV
ncbi:autophagy-related protein 27 [Mucidula mucida]|nr:autophagy-related protein 27 [Mucidula mucida]